MKLKTEKDITTIIQRDEWMMEVLKAAKSLRLSDWWICAGFVRSKIWDTLHGFDERTPLSDIDVIYYDSTNIDEKIEKEYEKKLKKLLSTIPWSVKNQARMHIANHCPPYTSAADAISKFPETATALGVKTDGADKVILTVPHGIEDVVNLIIKPTPYFSASKERMMIYEKRVSDKNWKTIWYKVEKEIVEDE